MKRFFFSMMALTAVAVGCTQSALVEAPDLLGTEISFSPYTGRTPETKAANIKDAAELAADGGFTVFCYLNEDTEDPYMNGRQVSSSDGATWSYGKPVLYWPDPTSPSTLSFVAYSSNAARYLFDKTNTSFTFRVPVKVSDQVDLLATALQKGRTLNNTTSGSVELKFKHLLSRVGFKVKATKESTRDITVSTLTFSGTMPVSGSLNLLAAENDATPKLTVSATESATTYEFLTDAVTFDSKTDPVQVVDEANGMYMMIMPHKVTRTFDHKITVEYQVTGMQNPKIAVVDLPSGFEFKPNTAYEFVLSIATSAISFDVVETDWNNNSGVSENYPLIPQVPDPVQISGVKVTGRTSATVMLNVAETGFTEVGIQYAEKGSDSWIPVASGVAVAKYEIPLADLTVDTEYVCRAYAVKDGATITYPANAADYTSFRTQGELAMVEIISDNIKTYTATVSATYVGSLENVREQGFCLMEGHGTPNLSNSVKVNGENEAAASFSIVFAVSPITEYSCCAYVKNDKGVVTFSDVQYFTTAPELGPEPGTDSGSNYEPVDPEKPNENTPGSDNIDPWEGEEDGDGDGEDDGVVDFE